MRLIRGKARISLILENRARRQGRQYVDRAAPQSGVDYSLIEVILEEKGSVSQR